MTVCLQITGDVSWSMRQSVWLTEISVGSKSGKVCLKEGDYESCNLGATFSLSTGGGRVVHGDEGDVGGRE